MKSRSQEDKVIVQTPAGAAMSAMMMGQLLDGRYEVEGVLGQGGMGIVWRGRHVTLDKPVAIKVLRGDMAHDAEMVMRFRTEAKASSSVASPHIVDVSDFGNLPDGSTYFVMELLEGTSLADLKGELGTIPLPRLVRLAKQIARGLIAAHTTGIIHRDLKPENIMLVHRDEQKDFVKILDFGLAKLSKGASKATRSGQVFGTPYYMSPEQSAGLSVDARSDIYAFGVILYEMASGRVPFDAETPMAILMQHMYKPPPSLVEVSVAQKIPSNFAAVVAKCLAKKPDARYASMLDVLSELERLEQGLAVDAASSSHESPVLHAPGDYFGQGAMQTLTPGAAFAPARPRRRRGGLLVAVAVLSLASGVGWTLTQRPEWGRRALAALPALDWPDLERLVSITPEPHQAVLPKKAPAVQSASPIVDSPAAALRHVTVKADPAEAVISRDGKELGTNVVHLELRPDERATLSVHARGYQSETIEVDDSAPVRSVKLALLNERGPSASPTKKTAASLPLPKPSPKRASEFRIGDEPDPFDPRAR